MLLDVGVLSESLISESLAPGVSKGGADILVKSDSVIIYKNKKHTTHTLYLGFLTRLAVVTG